MSAAEGASTPRTPALTQARRRDAAGGSAAAVRLPSMIGSGFHCRNRALERTLVFEMPGRLTARTTGQPASGAEAGYVSPETTRRSTVDRSSPERPDCPVTRGAFMGP
jgi:hypothetical protein